MNGMIWAVFAVFLAASVLFFMKAFPIPGPSRKKAVYKILPTSSCAVLALLGCIHCGQAFAWFLFLGLAVCAAADWLLEFQFMKGMAAFGLGHILYCIAYVLTGNVRMRSLWVFLILFTAVVVLWFRLKSGLDQAPVFLCYAAVLCTMAALASSLSFMMMAGGLLFVLSDVMIGVRLALKIEKTWYGAVIMVTYYAAQFLIGLGAWLIR